MTKTMESLSAGHTKLPWRQSHREKATGMYSTEIYDAAGEAIAQLYWHTVETEDGYTTDREANAAFIVLACNSFYQMRDALEMLIATIEAHEIESLSCDRDGEQWCDCLKRQASEAKAIVALARGESK